MHEIQPESQRPQDVSEIKPVFLPGNFARDVARIIGEIEDNRLKLEFVCLLTERMRWLITTYPYNIPRNIPGFDPLDHS